LVLAALYAPNETAVERAEQVAGDAMQCICDHVAQRG
jgi:hypothetical protein